MSLRVVAAAVIAALYWVPSACASSITNRDDKDWKVAVIEGATTKDHVLAPSAALDGICKQGCVIRLDGKDEYELKGSESVSIEDGYLYYDGPPASAEPKADDADRSFKPGAD